MISSNPSKTAIVLLSGGLDSTTLLAIARSENYQCHAISFRYGQRHQEELERAKSIAKEFDTPHRIVSIDLGGMGGSALTDDRIEVPKHDSVEQMGTDIPVTYVPARNTVFLSLALAWAEVVGAMNIFIGVNALDYSGYPDCRSEYIQSFERMANLATKFGVEGNSSPEQQSIRIQTPLIDLTKAEIIRRGIELGVDYRQTLSCYDPIDGTRPCRHCDACLLRMRGFEQNGMTDPSLD